MPQKKSSGLLSSYRKRQRSSKAFVGVLAGILILGGLVLLGLWAFGVLGGSALPFLATATPTPTNTLVPTPTPTNTPVPPTPIPSNTSTLAPTATQDGPMPYIVLADDTSCWGIAEKLKLDTDLFNVMLSINDCSLIREGDTLLIPAPWQTLPTETPLPTDIRRGTVIQIKAESGASFRSIAQAYNSTVAGIILESNKYRRTNDLALWTETSQLFIDDVVMVPVNIVTPTPTPTATRTVTPTATR